MTKAGIEARDRTLRIFAAELCDAPGELRISRRRLAELMGSDIVRAPDGFRLRFVSRRGSTLAVREIRLSQPASSALLDYLGHRGFCLGMEVPFWIGRKGDGRLRADSIRRILRG